MEYILKNIYLIHYKPPNGCEFSIGIINKIKNNVNEIYHNVNASFSSIGYQLLFFNKVIAVQRKLITKDKYNKGILLNFLINKYYKKNKNKNIIKCNEEKEIINREIEQIENPNQNFIQQNIPSGNSKPISGEQLDVIMEQMKTKYSYILSLL